MEIPVPTPPPGDPAAAQPGTATPPVPAPPPAAPAVEPPAANATPAASGGELLGEAGLRALQAERANVQALKDELKTLEPLKKLAEALGAGDPAKGKTDVEQVTERLKAHEDDLAKERTARWRAEVAHSSGFTPEQAEELRGSTKEELTAHAEKLKTLFAAQPGQTPRWGPSDAGPRNTQPQKLADQIAEAEKNKDFRLARSLKAQQLADLPKTN